MRTPRFASLPVMATAALLLPAALAGQSAKEMVVAHVEHYAADYGAMAQQIWDWAEVGYQEHESSGLLQARLAEHGFRVEAGVAGIFSLMPSLAADTKKPSQGLRVPSMSGVTPSNGA